MHGSYGFDILAPLLASAGGLEAHLIRVGGFLGGFYILLALMNATAAYYWWQQKHDNSRALVWVAVAGLYMILAPLAMSTYPNWVPAFPKFFTDTVNNLTGPVMYSVGTTAILVILYVFRRFFVKPDVAWALLNLTCFAMALALANEDFAAIVTKPDNVPIVGLVFLLGYFTWLATAKAVENDERIAQGLPPTEKLDDEKILVWPDLVYTELICMIALTAFLLFWAISLQAPLEEPASSVKTPNPSKAPWYFLGLQEMLVYYDPWYAGVVLPSLIVFGLMAIPFIDFNPKGNGYYTISQRKFSYIIFQFGFLEMWITLIILGTFLRGPNWNFFGPFEQWDAHKVEQLSNKDLSEFFWIKFLGVGLPKSPVGADALTQFGYILWRESVGIVLTLAYFIILPPLMATTIFRKFFAQMGFIRYMIMANLLLFMLSLPLKMLLRWIFNLKYIISIPEYFLNF
ncbi:MAG: hypothetical protein SGJ20_02695 [Planctomycetota bacterium]|nr:hypothetical protein [Planctomycetota bacterium]